MKIVTSLILVFLINLTFSQNITLRAPAGDTTFAGGGRVDITWSAFSITFAEMVLSYSLNNGANWHRCGGEPDRRSHCWIAPYLKYGADSVLIEIVAFGYANPPTDTTDTVFSITAAPPDAYEPNDSLSEAYAVTVGDTILDAVVMGSTYDSLYTDSTAGDGIDIDYFSFDIEAGKLLTIRTVPSYDDSGTNIYNLNHNAPDIILYNSSGEVMDSGSVSVSYDVETTDTYYCAISGPDMWHKYGLTVTDLSIEGCMDTSANNYDPAATVPCAGCCDTTASIGYFALQGGNIMKLTLGMLLVSLDADYSVSVRKVNGNQVFFSGRNSSGRYDVSHLKAGLYLVTVAAGNRRYEKKAVIF
jgi:hypothetical protein